MKRAPPCRPHHFAIEFRIERNRDQAEAEIEEQDDANDPDYAADGPPILAADSVTGKHAHAAHDQHSNEHHERRQIKQQEAREDAARFRVGLEGERTEAHLAPALVPEACHRPGDEQAERKPADHRLPHVGQAEKETAAVAPATYAAPAGPRQAITKCAEAGDPAQIENRYKRDCPESGADGFVSASDQCLCHEAQPEIGQAEQQDDHHEAEKQFHAGAGPFEVLIDEARPRPQITAFARSRPEPVNAQRHDGQQKVGQRDPREILPVTFENEGAVTAFHVLRPLHNQ